MRQYQNTQLPPDSCYLFNLLGPRPRKFDFSFYIPKGFNASPVVWLLVRPQIAPGAVFVSYNWPLWLPNWASSVVLLGLLLMLSSNHEYHGMVRGKWGVCRGEIPSYVSIWLVISLGVRYIDEVESHQKSLSNRESFDLLVNPKSIHPNDYRFLNVLFI